MIKELTAYDVPFSDIEKRAIEWAEEALELRHGDAGDPEGKLNTSVEAWSDPAVVRLEMLRVRKRADRIDELRAKATQAKSRAKRAREKAKFEADMAYHTAMQENRARRGEGFFSADERKADASLDSLEQKRIAHHADRMVTVLEEVHEVISQIHFQFEGIRRDLRATLNALQFESSLDR